MPSRPQVPSAEDLERAVRLWGLPGITLAEASRRTGVSLGALRRGRKAGVARITRDDLLLAALTRNGEASEGTLPEASEVAAWLDYVNHDGTDAAEVRRDLHRLAAEGVIALSDGRYRLLVRWP